MALELELARICEVNATLQSDNDELVSAELKKSLHSRQRMKLEEREVMIRKITSQCEELQRENNRVLVENGRLVDVVSALEAALVEVKTHTAREMDFLAPRFEELESKAEALAHEIQKNTLDIDMMSGLVQRHLKTATDLSLKIKMKAQLDEKTSTVLETIKLELKNMTQLAVRRGHVASVCMVARRAAQSRSKQTAKNTEALKMNMETLQMQNDAKQAVIDTFKDQILRLDLMITGFLCLCIQAQWGG